MPSLEPADRSFISDISKELVAEVAPEEADMFDDLAAEYFENPQPPDLKARASDDPLGFGLDTSIVAATPAIMAAVTAVVGIVWPIALDAFKDEGKDFARRKLRDLLGGKPPADASPLPLTVEQLKEVRQLALKEAECFGMKNKDAQHMADALVGRLTLKS